jgi:hypothetical protein
MLSRARTMALRSEAATTLEIGAALGISHDLVELRYQPELAIGDRLCLQAIEMGLRKIALGGGAKSGQLIAAIFVAKCKLGYVVRRWRRRWQAVKRCLEEGLRDPSAWMLEMGGGSFLGGDK